MRFCRLLGLLPPLLSFVALGQPVHAATVTNINTSSASSYRYALSELDEGRGEAARALLSQGSDPVLNRVLQGTLMAMPGNDYSFDELAAFVTDNPDWPERKGIMMIAERKIPAGASSEQIVNWFNANPPLTTEGFLRYVDALNAVGYGQKATEMVRAWWVDKDMGTEDRTAFASRFSPILTAQDHWKRLDRLLWENNMTLARAMFPYVSEGYRDLAEARIALANQTSGAQAALARVPSSLQNDAGLLYERLRWRRKSDDDQGALEILHNAPEHLGHASEWWDETSIMIRRAMEKHDFKSAYRLAANSKLSTGFDYVQAEFLAGWLALRFNKRPDLAYKHFMNILNDATSPISRARGFYWLGRAYEAVGQNTDAAQAYQSAAVFSTTYYGQLAMTRLEAQPVIRATSEPSIPTNVRAGFFKRNSVTAVAHLFKIGETERARKFFKSIANEASQRVEFALLLELAYHLDRPDWAVLAAKAATQKNYLMTGGAYPVLSMELPSPPELALTHALIRQESEFKADAGSPVGARGLMQLMPGTAKDVARKLGMEYNPARLIDPDYNVKLGTYFIQTQIDNFDGSYILALAGYNAGPRRVREWIELFGDPRTADVDPIDWVELIPIYETRNYVQRIIENLQFYRARLGNGQAALTILRDLKR